MRHRGAVWRALRGYKNTTTAAELELPRERWSAFDLAANLASIAGVIIAIFAIWEWDSEAILLGYICALSLFLLWRYLRQERWARYAAAMRLLQRAYDHLDDAAEHTIFVENREMATEKLVHSLDALADAFTFVVGDHCRVCVAETYAAPKDPRSGATSNPEDLAMYARVVWRSHVKRQTPGDPQLVQGNTDFVHSMTTYEPFFSNDLLSAWLQRKYENSKWNEYKVSSGAIDYRSAIVIPVVVEGPASTDKSPKVIAFLCIDSKRKRAFMRDCDVAMGACYAHALYPVLRKLLSGESRNMKGSRDGQN